MNLSLRLPKLAAWYPNLHSTTVWKVQLNLAQGIGVLFVPIIKKARYSPQVSHHSGGRVDIWCARVDEPASVPARLRRQHWHILGPSTHWKRTLSRMTVFQPVNRLCQLTCDLVMLCAAYGDIAICFRISDREGRFLYWLHRVETSRENNKNSAHEKLGLHPCRR